MAWIMVIGFHRYEVEERLPRTGETFMNITGHWKVAEKDYDYLALPVLIRELSEDE